MGERAIVDSVIGRKKKYVRDPLQREKKEIGNEGGVEAVPADRGKKGVYINNIERKREAVSRLSLSEREEKKKKERRI